MSSLQLDTNLWLDDRLSGIVAKGGSSSPAGTTQTQTTQDPWSGQQPYLAQGFQSASNLFNSPGPQYFPNSTVAPQGAATQQAIAGEIQRGTDGAPIDNAAIQASTNNLQPGALYANPGNVMYGAGAFSQNPALGLSQQQAMFGAPGTQQLGQLSRQGVPNFSAALLGGVANGSQNSNPFLQDQFNAMSADIGNQYQTLTAPGVAGQFEGSGRYGSGSYAMGMGNANRALASQLATAGSNLLGTNYNLAAQRQIDASGQIQNAANTSAQQKYNASSALGNLGLGATQNFGQLGQQQIGNMLAGAQGVSGNYNSALQNQAQLSSIAPSLAQEGVKNLALVQDAGQQQDSFQQAQLNDQIQRYNYNQMLPYQQLQTFMNSIQGNYGGTQTVTQPFFRSNTSQLGGALSGAAAGASMGAMAGPWGALAGGAAGGLMGAFGS